MVVKEARKLLKDTFKGIKQIEEHITPGSVIVLHDGKGHGVKVALIIDTIIPRLKQQGYSFIKVEDMKA